MDRTKARYLVIIAAVLQAVSLATIASAASPEASGPGSLPPLIDVPEYRADAARTSVYPGPGPVAAPVLVWSRSTGSSISFNAVLADGALLAGATDGSFFALDARTGSERWRYKADSTIVGTGSAGDGVVVFGEQAGILHAIDIASGHELWTHDTPGVQVTAIQGGIVYVSGERVLGLDLHDGSERWSWTSPATVERVSVVGDTLYASALDGRLYAVSLADASERWNVETISPTVGLAMVGPDTIYLATVSDTTTQPAGELYAIDPSTGAIRWRFRGPSGDQVSNGAIGDGIEYSGTIQDGIYALREQPGPDGQPQVVWHTDLPGEGVIYRNADRVGDILYFGVYNPGALLAVDTASGTILWNVPMEGNPNSIVVSGGMIFGGSDAGDLFAYAEPSLAAAIGSVASGPLNTDVIAHAENDPFTIQADLRPDTTGLSAISDLAVGPDGLVYVIDLEDRVVVIDPADGHVVRTWGHTGSGPGEFSFQSDDGNPGHGAIAVGPDGQVYVGDGNNHRYQVFTNDGTFVRQVGSYGRGDGQFSRIFHIAVDAEGSVYAVDHDLLTLSKFDRDGHFVWRTEETGGTPQPRILQSVIARPDGRLFQVVEEGPVLELDPTTGAVIDRWDIGPTGWLSFDTTGNAYATDYQPPALQVFDPEHHLIGGSYGSGNFRFIVIGPHDEVISWPGGFDGSFQVLSVDLPKE